MKWRDLDCFREDSYDILRKLNDLERKGKVILPPRQDLFRAFTLTKLEQIRVIILGQDPYHTLGMANGLAFSVNRGVKPFPPSLVNIFTELVSDIGCPEPEHGDLTCWAKQGVLLLNTSLSVEEGLAGSHKDLGWDKIIIPVIEALPRKVWVLWGAQARAYLKYIPQPKSVITSAHPSPLSAYKGFFGSKPFSKVNMYIQGPPINWEVK